MGAITSTSIWTAVGLLAYGWDPLPAAAAGGGLKSADTAWVHIGPAEGGTLAFVASPPGQAAVPAVIVVHEGWGPKSQIRDVARRLSLQGYVAIVPELHHGQEAVTAERADEPSRRVDPERASNDLDGAAQWLRRQPRTAKSRMGVIGFSLGGTYSLDYALHRPVSAVVLFYGPPESDPRELETLGAPLQGHFGAADQGISVERVEAFRAALKKAGKSAEIYLYPSAGQAFMHEGMASYHADAARQAWARLLAFLQRTLKG